MHAFTHLDRKQHGTLAFPVEYYYVDRQHPRYQMPFHWHNEWEILRILDGSMEIYLDDEHYSLRRGDVLLIRGGMLHGAQPEQCIYECLVFDLYGLFRKMDMVKPYLRPFYRQTRFPQSCYPGELCSGIHASVDTLMNIFRTSTSCCPELETVGCLSSLFAWILRSGCWQEAPQPENGGGSRADRIKPVLEYMEEHHSENLTLESLAQIAGMNPKYFCRVFRSLTHHTPIDYVNFYRIEQAAYLLDSTDLSVTAVAAECGFWESSYFTKVFRKYKGQTPSQYRKNTVK